MANTGDDLINSVRTQITIPNNQALLTDERIFSLANGEMDAHVISLVLSLRQEFFVTVESEATVNGVEEYKIPYRAIGRVLRDIKISDNSQIRKLTQIMEEDAHLFNYSSSPNAFYMRGDKIVLVPTPASPALQILKYYPLRPNRIISVNQAAKAVGISGNIVTASFVPSNIIVGSVVDVIQGIQGNSTLGMDLVVTNIAGTQITLSAVPAAMVIGDYIALAEQTPVIQLPDECMPFLVDLTAAQCLQAVGDYEGKKDLDAGLAEKRKQLAKTMAPRVEGSNQKVLNRSGLLRGNRVRRALISR